MSTCVCEREMALCALCDEKESCEERHYQMNVQLLRINDDDDGCEERSGE